MCSFGSLFWGGTLQRYFTIEGVPRSTFSKTVQCKIRTLKNSLGFVWNYTRLIFLEGFQQNLSRKIEPLRVHFSTLFFFFFGEYPLRAYKGSPTEIKQRIILSSIFTFFSLYWNSTSKHFVLEKLPSSTALAMLLTPLPAAYGAVIETIVLITI